MKRLLNRVSRLGDVAVGEVAVYTPRSELLWRPGRARRRRRCSRNVCSACIRVLRGLALLQPLESGLDAPWAASHVTSIGERARGQVEQVYDCIRHTLALRALHRVQHCFHLLREHPTPRGARGAGHRLRQPLTAA
jgi:hypothetical protein